MTTMIQMPVTAWIAVQDNPRQRDTLERAKRARHLRHASKDHSVVSAARLPNGDLVKIDGHTRALLWSTNEIEAPEYVNVVLYDVRSLEEAKDIYTHYDSPEALERVRDRVFGGLRETGILAGSDLIRSGQISHSLKTAAVYAGLRGGIYDLMRAFEDSIAFLDSLNLKRGSYSAGIIAALILTHHRDGKKAEKFWRDFVANRGKKYDGSMDGLQAMHELALWAKGRYGGGAISAICRRAVNAYEKFQAGEMMTRMPRAANLNGFMSIAA